MEGARYSARRAALRHRMTACPFSFPAGLSCGIQLGGAIPVEDVVPDDKLIAVPVGNGEIAHRVSGGKELFCSLQAAQRLPSGWVRD